MARAHRESITIEFTDTIGEQFFKYDITEHEAESMYYALQEVLGIECVDVPFKECPSCGVREGDQHKSNCTKYIVENYARVGDAPVAEKEKSEIDWSLQYSYGRGEQAVYKGNPVPKSHWQTLVDALKSIATSSCCGDCEEAKRVAEVALYEAEVVSSIPVRGTYDDIRQCPETLKTQIKTEDGWKELYGEPNTYDWKQEYSHMYWTLKDLLKRSKCATDIAKVVNELEKIHATFPNPTKV